MSVCELSGPTAGSVWGGVGQSMIDLVLLNLIIPEDVVNKIEVAKAAIPDGSLHPFAGPVISQDGAVITPEGENMDDAALSGMNFYVKGIVGSLPNRYLEKITFSRELLHKQKAEVRRTL